MRRRDREMSKEFGVYVIDEAQFGTVSMVDENGLPYAIPLSLARHENALYFHSARSGKKIELLHENQPVNVVFVTDVQVPELYTDEELNEIANNPKQLSELTSHVFTTEFASCLVEGTINKIEDDIEKIIGLKTICEKFTPSKMKYFEAATTKSINAVAVYKISIDTISAKRKKFDSQHEEMKWERME